MVDSLIQPVTGWKEEEEEEEEEEVEFWFRID